jgi:hypothetical protein
LEEPLLDLIRAAQEHNKICLKAIQDEIGKRNTEGELIWTKGPSRLLCWNNRIVVPRDLALQEEILKIHHDDPLAGHYGSDKTFELLTRHFYWPNMEADVRTWVRECDIYQRIKAKRHMPYGLLDSLPQPDRPWAEISMDFITGLPKSKSAGGTYDAILVVMDRYSKMSRYIPCRKTIDSPELAKILWKEVFSLFGTPSSIVSDRGTVFTSQFWSALC